MSTEKDIDEEFETDKHERVGQLMKMPTRREKQKDLLNIQEEGIKVKYESRVVKQGITNKGVKIIKEDDIFRRNLINTITQYQKLVK